MSGTRVMVAMSRKCFSLDFKHEVIMAAERHKGPKKDLCKKFNITPSTLATFIKNKEKIQSYQLESYG